MRCETQWAVGRMQWAVSRTDILVCPQKSLIQKAAGKMPALPARDRQECLSYCEHDYYH